MQYLKQPEREVPSQEQEEDEVTAKKRLVKELANIVARLYAEQGD